MSFQVGLKYGMSLSMTSAILFRKFLEKSLKLAKKSALEGEVPVGSVIVKDGQIIGRGRNQREKQNDPLAHAEIMAIRKAARKLGSWRLEGCILVTTLEPCPMCLAACQQARIDKVIYGAADRKGGALSLGYRLNQDGRLHHRFEVVHEYDENCGKILKDFFRALRFLTRDPARPRKR